MKRLFALAVLTVALALPLSGTTFLINPYSFASLQHVADANARLSLVGISVGKHVFQDDNSTEYVYNGDAEAVQILSAGTEAANGYYTKRGTLNGRGFYALLGQLTTVTDPPSTAYSVLWNGSQWKLYNDGGTPLYRSFDDVASPWLVTTWDQQDGANPVPTTAHVSSKNSLQTACFVSLAGTAAANGIYTERPGLGMPVAGRKVYNLLGQSDSLTNYAIVPSAGVIRWTITDSSGATLYTSPDSVQYPWQVTTWVAVAVPLENLPTVASVTQRDIDAGCTMSGAVDTPTANDTYKVVFGVYELARNTYVGMANGFELKDPGEKGWVINGNDPQSTPPAEGFPWQATFNDSATVTRNDIASESNWCPL